MGCRARVEALRRTLVACLVTLLAPACGETIADQAEPSATMGSASDAGGSLSQATTNTTATGSGGSSSSRGSGGAAGASCDANAGGGETWPALDYSACAAPLVGEGGAAGGGFDEMCIGVGYEAQAAPTSLFLLVDDSVHATRFELERWSSLLDAVQRLANAPATGKVWVGLELMSRAAEAAGAAEYAPLVPLVEGNSWPLVHRELSSADPEGMPATLPALETALAYARSHASEHGERRTSLVLVSSGHMPACSGEATLDLLENAVVKRIMRPPR